MGWEFLNNPKSELATQEVTMENLSGGWWPETHFEGIPGNLFDPKSVHGALSSEGFVYYNKRLRPFFGTTSVNTTGSGNITSLFYSQLKQTAVGTRGTKIYSDYHTAAPTDITSAVVVTANNLVSWVDWQFDTTKIIIGTNGVDPPWKVPSGVGNASLLAGSPPSGKFTVAWQNAVWIASTSTAPATIYFSALGDAENWDSTDNYVFDSPITGLATFGDQLIVFMTDHIGIMSGTNNRLLTKVDRWIEGIGTAAHYTIAHAKFGGRDVLVFNADDGIYVYDGSRNPLKISKSIEQLYINPDATKSISANQRASAIATYLPKLNWYILAIPYAGTTTNNLKLVVDLGNPFQFMDHVCVPCWPRFFGADLAWSAITLIPGATIDQSIFYGNQSTGVRRMGSDILVDTSFNPPVWHSKFYDLGQSAVVQNFSALMKDIVSSTSFSMGINETLSLSTFNESTVDMDGTEDFKKVNAPDFTGWPISSRFIQIQFELQIDQNFELDKIYLVLTPMGSDLIYDIQSII